MLLVPLPNVILERRRLQNRGYKSSLNMEQNLVKMEKNLVVMEKIEEMERILVRMKKI
jgi:hypothetical protein